jgi:hypothetical protein
MVPRETSKERAAGFVFPNGVNYIHEIRVLCLSDGQRRVKQENARRVKNHNGALHDGLAPR